MESKCKQKGYFSVVIANCIYCNEELTCDKFTWDHVYPQKHYKQLHKHVAKLVVPSCKKCNGEKGDLSLEEFLQKCINKTNIINSQSNVISKWNRRIININKLLIQIEQDQNPNICQ